MSCAELWSQGLRGTEIQGARAQGTHLWEAPTTVSWVGAGGT